MSTTFPSRPPAAVSYAGRRLRRSSSLVVIEQAKGLLVRHLGLDAEAAFDLLRCWANETNSTVLTVAHVLVSGTSPEGTGRPWNRAVRTHVGAALDQLAPGRIE